ncbi:MAG: GntR family transcriptional regulator [Sporomusaceae bacterium]|nr:GntR family transcriptional regulator [Sporomusaceae bacterium]
MKSQITTSYRTVPGLVTHALREGILSGEFSGGMQLKQEELARKFSVSLSALREALKSLESEGLVRFYPNRGVVVSELSAAEAREIFDIRLFLELGALELSVRQLTEAELQAAEGVLEAIDTEVDSTRWSELNWQFHEILYQAADRPKLLALLKTLHNNVERYMRLYLSTMQYQEKSQAEHRALLAACRDRDIDRAQQLLRTHMANASSSLATYLNPQL